MATPNDTTIYNTNIPSYLQQPVQQVIASSQALADANMNYVPFQGQGVGGTQLAGLDPQTVQGMQAMQAMQPSAYTTDAAGLAGLAGSNQFTGANVNQYMSPYMNDVVNMQSQAAIRDYAQQLPGMSSVATGAGGLGGARQALVQANSQQGLQNTLAGINATGLQSAFQNAQDQFNKSNQNMLSASTQLGALGQQDYAQNMGIAQGNINAGNIGQTEMQNQYNIQYQNFKDSINQPFAMLSWEDSQLHGGSPASLGTSYQKTDYSAPVNNALLGASALTGSGGIASLLGGSSSPSAA